MKRIFSFFVVGLGMASFLGGCPIYSGGGGGNRVCTASGCYDCTGSSYDPSSCSPWSCGNTADCPSGYLCQSGSCVGTPNPTSCTSPAACAPTENCGSDGTCHTGDCSQTGCVTGYSCKVSSGVASCVKDGISTPTCSDSECASKLGAGAKCLSGSCVAPADQCTDGTQCAANYQCVQGVCTPACSSTKPCATGYSCDLTKGVCTGNPTPCSNGGTCGGGNVCVDTHCVAPCGPNNTCGAGLICVAGGCTPDEKPKFVCSVEGVQDVCAAGSLCLHHNCYIACDGTAGSCKSADKFNVCKAVTTGTGSYQVCGSDSNLGSDCDPTVGKNCTNALICIDGFCR
jgi:hypothetical protein